MSALSLFWDPDGHKKPSEAVTDSKLKATKERYEKELLRQELENYVVKKGEEEASRGQKKALKSFCYLHAKPNQKCKKCQAFLAQEDDTKQKQPKPKASVDASSSSSRAAEKKSVTKRDFQCSSTLRDEILACAHYKHFLGIDDAAALVREAAQCLDSLDVYEEGSPASPSAFVSCAYRLSSLPLSDAELRSLLEGDGASAAVRCAGLLCIRCCSEPAELWQKLEAYLHDDAAVPHAPKGAADVATVSDYAELLLMTKDYATAALPSLLSDERRGLKEKLAALALPEFRARLRKNRLAVKEASVEDWPVKVLLEGSFWLSGVATQLDASGPSRPRLQVWLDCGKEETALLGNVEFTDEFYAQQAQADAGGRGQKRPRSSSRGRG